MSESAKFRTWASAPRRWNLERREAAMLGAIVLATALIYMPSIRNGWVWDDTSQIVDAELLHSWSGIGKSFVTDSWWFQDPAHLPKSAYYRPFQAAWFGLNYMLLGNHPALWHLEKLVLELIAVVLSFRLAQLLTGSNTIALITAAIFGLLPGNAESVLWTSAIGEPLSTIFEMGGLCCFIQRGPGWSRNLGFALMLYAGAMLSHETAILFALIVAANVFLIERRSARESIRLATPFMLLAVVYLGARLNALGTSHFLGLPHPEEISTRMGWAGPPVAHGISDWMLTAPVVLLVYLGVLIVPGIAAPAHNIHWITSASPITLVAAGILAALAAIASAAAWRSPHRRVYMFCAAWSVLTMAPSMRLSALATIVEDRLLYAPSFGLSLAFALGAVEIAAVFPRARAAMAGAMAIVLAAYAVSIVRMERYWRDDLTFFARCEQLDPHDADYIRVRVTLMNSMGDFAPALDALQHAVDLEPDNPYLHLRLAEQYGLMQRGSDSAAEIEKTRALWARARAAAASGATRQR